MAEVTLDQVTMKYWGAEAEGRSALHDVSLTIADGETLAVVGPSGCGKSTLLKLVAGLEFPTAGHVRYNGYDVTQVEPQDRGVGMVFQDYALYPTMKGKGNLSYFFEVNQRTEEEMEQHVREVSALMGVGFEVLLGQMPTTLSGGEKQRVAIARCIVRRPPVFLMDEPICNLDAKLRERTRIEMRRMLQRYKVTTVYVTHDQQEAIFMGDRIAVMRAGRLEQIGTFDELYYTPANRFVAEFIGTPPMVFLPVVKQGNVLTFQAEGTTFTLPAELETALPDGALHLGVRAESWQLVTDGGGESLTMRVSSSEYIPTQQATYVNGQIGDTRLTVLAPASYARAATARLVPSWDAVYFFEAEGERVLRTPAIPELF